MRSTRSSLPDAEKRDTSALQVNAKRGSLCWEYSPSCPRGLVGPYKERVESFRKTPEVTYGKAFYEQRARKKDRDREKGERKHLFAPQGSATKFSKGGGRETKGRPAYETRSNLGEKKFEWKERTLQP